MPDPDAGEMQVVSGKKPKTGVCAGVHDIRPSPRKIKILLKGLRRVHLRP